MSRAVGRITQPTLDHFQQKTESFVAARDVALADVRDDETAAFLVRRLPATEVGAAVAV